MSTASLSPTPGQAVNAAELSTRKLLVVLGVPIDDLNMEEALARIERFVEHGRRTGRHHQIATVNADFVVKSLRDPELRLLLQEADMATADGMPLVWGARLLGVHLEGRVTGADLVPALAERAAEKGYSLYLLGAAPGVAARAAEVLQSRYPKLQITGVQSPPYRSLLEMERTIADRIREARPDILLVALGNPKQEKWIGMYGQELGVPVMIGVGGTLDLIAGELKRAPRWMQRFGLEWLYRLLQEPGRLWKRYVVDMLDFSSFFVRQWWVMRRRQQPVAFLPSADLLLLEQGVADRTVAILNVQGHLDLNYNEVFKQRCAQALQKTPFIILNLEKARFMDSSVIGTLVVLAKEAREAGGELRLAAVPPNIRRTLELLRLDRFFPMDDALDDALDPEQPLTTSEKLLLEGDWAVYKVPRRLDAQNTPEMLEQCLTLLGGNPFLIVDFAGTVFLTSAGLAALVTLHREAEAANGALRVAGCSDDVLEVLRMVRFEKVLALYPDLPTATAAPLEGERSQQAGPSFPDPQAKIE